MADMPDPNQDSTPGDDCRDVDIVCMKEASIRDGGNGIDPLRSIASLAKRMHELEGFGTLDESQAHDNVRRLENGQSPRFSGVRYSRSITTIARAILHEEIIVAGTGLTEALSAASDEDKLGEVFEDHISAVINFNPEPDLDVASVTVPAERDFLTAVHHAIEEFGDQGKKIGVVDTVVSAPDTVSGVYRLLHAAMVSEFRERGVDIAYALCRVDNPVIGYHKHLGYEIAAQLDITESVDPFEPKKDVPWPHYLLRLDINSPRQDELVENFRAQSSGQLSISDGSFYVASADTIVIRDKPKAT